MPIINQTDALISAAQISAEMRTGVVVDWNPSTLKVMIGGSTFDAAFLDSYNPPGVGDLVIAVRQNAAWLVLGRLAGNGANPNLVLNPDFDEGAIGSTPTNWTVQAWPGGPALATTITLQLDPGSPGGGNVARQATNAVAQDTGLLSNYIPVNEGESYFISAYVASHSVTNLQANYPNVEIHAIWQTTSTEAFPGALADDSSMVANWVDVPESSPYKYIYGTATVPTGATFMRVGLRTNTAAGVTSGATQWDSVVCRRSI